MRRSDGPKTSRDTRFFDACRVPRAVIALIAAAACITFRPSIVSADDSPAAETSDRSASPSARQVANSTPGSSASRVDSFGTFSDSIPLSVPPFREITPELSLVYRSSGGNGWLGVGWQLDGIGRIERASPGKGAPRYDATDIYLLDGEELIACAPASVSPSCTSGGTHSTKTESYSRYQLSGSGTAARWTVTDKDGTRSVYAPVLVLPGADGASGSADDLVFRWGLQQVIDTKNNVVTYNWGVHSFAGTWDYLDSVNYGGTTIKFHYEQRPDVESAAVGAGQLERVTGRIKTVDVSVSGNRLRAYKLSYTTSGATGRSLLTSVQQFGRDAALDASGTVTGGTSLPALTAGYPVATSPAFTAGGSDGSMVGSMESEDSRFITMDVNGDGKSDIVEVWMEGIQSLPRASVWISNGVGFGKTSTIEIPAFSADSQFLAMDVNGDGKDDLVSIIGSTRRIFLSTGTTLTAGTTDTATYAKLDEVTTRVVVGDFNGDGKTDIVELVPKWECVSSSGTTCTTYSKYFQRVTWLSNGSGFTKSSSAGGVIPVDKSIQFFAGDFDGDGKSDLFELSPGADRTRVWRSTGTGFASAASFASAGTKSLVMDVNGDGKTDVVELSAEGVGTRRKTYLSTGSSFTLSESTWSKWSFSGSRFVAGDVNGDGKSDYIAMVPNLWFNVHRTVFLSDGAGFDQVQSDTLGNGNAHRYLAADVNGDGRSDVVELYDESAGWKTRRRVWLTAGPQPDLLTSLGGGLGGTTTVSYRPSSAWTSINNLSVTQTVTAVTVADGRGGSSTTTYSYSEGQWDWANRRSLGFLWQRETQPCIAGESACPYTKTKFRQDYGALGKPSRIYEYDGSGQLLRAELFEYTTNDATVPWTALPTEHWAYTYVNTGAACPGAECKRTRTTTTYNAYGEVTRVIDDGDRDVTGDETTTVYAYVPNTTAYIVDRPSLVTVHQGAGTGGTAIHQKSFYYDGANTMNQAPSVGFATATFDWLNTSSSYVPTHQVYDAWGNLTAVIDALGARTTTTYDATGLYPSSVTNAAGHVTSTIWDTTCGVPTQTTDINGQVTSITYDALCRVVQKTAPGAKFEKHSWVSLGDPAAQYEQVEVPAADGTTQPRWSRRHFDGLGRTWRTVKKGPDAATGNIYADTTYNARGGQASQTEPYYWVSGSAATYTTTYAYDALDRPTRVTAPDGAQQNTSYGLWSVTTTDELGRAKTDRFDASGLRVAHDEVVSGVTKTTTYVYDARKNLRQSIDPAGNTITYTTDSLGRTTSMVDPDWGTWAYEYDVLGRRTAHIDPRGQRTTWEYDDLGRPLSKKSRAGTAQEVTASWTYDESRTGYYNRGALTTVSDGAGSKTLDRDLAGRVVTTTRTIDGASYTFQYGFDASDRPLWTVYPDGDSVGTAAAPLRYDSAGRLKSVPGYVTSATYAADGQVRQITNANGTTTTRTRSPARGWLTGITTTAGAATIQNLVYTRNAKGLVTQVQSPVASEGWTYAYDDLDRLTTATNAANAAYDQTLAYDAIGNITSNSRRGAYVYGTRPHAVTAAGTSAYTYDGAGLMLSAPDRTLTWDGDNRLASVTSAGTTTTFTYDADGARIQAVEGATNRRYLGDDYEITNLNLVTKYVSVGGLTVARKEGTTTTWLHTDQLGSVQAQTNASGASVHRKLYRPYGEILSTSGSLDDEPLGFTGQRHDGSGLVYLHARYYDPALGRFVSPDFIIDGSDTVGLNRYAYAGNDPTNSTDPSGLARVSGIRAAQRVSKAGGDVNVNRPSGLGYVGRSPGASRTTQIRSARTSSGGTNLTTKHGSFYFAPKRRTVAASAPAYAPYAPVAPAASGYAAASVATPGAQVVAPVPAGALVVSGPGLAPGASGVLEPERHAADGLGPLPPRPLGGCAAGTGNAGGVACRTNWGTPAEENAAFLQWEAWHESLTPSQRQAVMDNQERALEMRIQLHGMMGRAGKGMLFDDVPSYSRPREQSWAGVAEKIIERGVTQGFR